MQPMKDVAASAKSGMEKAKATAQEKAERMTTSDPLKKEAAIQKKEERISQAEMEKEAARGTSAHTGGGVTTGHHTSTTTTRSGGTTGGGYSTTGTAGRPGGTY